VVTPFFSRLIIMPAEALLPGRQTFLDHLAATPIPEDSVLEMSLYEKAEDLYRWLTLVIDLEVNTKPLNMSDVPEGNGEAGE
jgi:hypothetical protein